MANARMFLECMEANKPESKQLFNVSTSQSNRSLQFVTPLFNRYVDDPLVKILPAPAGTHSVLEIDQVGNWNVIHGLLLSPLAPYSIVNWVQVPAVGGYRQFDEF